MSRGPGIACLLFHNKLGVSDMDLYKPTKIVVNKNTVPIYLRVNFHLHDGKRYCEKLLDR